MLPLCFTRALPVVIQRAAALRSSSSSIAHAPRRRVGASQQRSRISTSAPRTMATFDSAATTPAAAAAGSGAAAAEDSGVRLRLYKGAGGALLARVTLNRERLLNALDATAVEAVRAHLLDVAAGPHAGAAAVVLDGCTPRAFCAGEDRWEGGEGVVRWHLATDISPRPSLANTRPAHFSLLRQKKKQTEPRHKKKAATSSRRARRCSRRRTTARRRRGTTSTACSRCGCSCVGTLVCLRFL